MDGIVSPRTLPSEGHAARPENAADDVEDGERAPLHRADPGHDRGEGADDGHEASHDDRPAARSLSK